MTVVLLFPLEFEDEDGTKNDSSATNQGQHNAIPVHKFLNNPDTYPSLSKFFDEKLTSVYNLLSSM